MSKMGTQNQDSRFGALDQEDFQTLAQRFRDLVQDQVAPRVKKGLGTTDKYLADPDNEDTPKYDEYYDCLDQQTERGVRDFLAYIMDSVEMDFTVHETLKSKSKYKPN